MKQGDKLIVSVKVYAEVTNVQDDGTFDVIVTEMGGSDLQPRIAVKGLLPSQLEAFV